MAIAFQHGAFQDNAVQGAEPYRALRLALSDRRALAALSDRRALAALELGPLPELTVGAVMVASGRVPMLTTTGTLPGRNAAETPWWSGSATVQGGIIRLGPTALLAAEPAHYVPGALRPQDANGFTRDTIRVTDAVGTYRDLFAWWHADYVPGDQALEVAIGEDGVAGLYSGGKLTLTATGGTGPYTWDFASNPSGGTLTPEGVYVAGPLVGVDRLRVTDSLGAIGLVQAEVLAGQLGADMTGDQEAEKYRFNVYGFACQPYARVWGENGVAPYSVAMQDNQTGATIEPPKNMRATFALQDLDGVALDLTGWTFDAKMYSQRGGLMAEDLAVTFDGNVVSVDLPEPSELVLIPAVLRVTATTAGAVAVVGYLTTSFEMLLVADEILPIPEET
jgi:hypothetical protein